MAIDIATSTGGYQAIKEESESNDASIFIDTENFDLFGHFEDSFDFLNEKTIMITTADYNVLSTAEEGTTDYELWHNPHITWVVQDDNELESVGLNTVNVTGSTLNITLSTKK